MECGLTQADVTQILAVALGGIIIIIGFYLLCSSSMFVVNHYLTSKGKFLFFSGIFVSIFGVIITILIGTMFT